MTDMTLADASLTKAPAPNSTDEPKFAWAIPVLLVIALLATITGSLCIGAYPMSFWKAGEIVMHLAWPFPLPAHPAWNIKELTVVEIIRLPRVLLAVVVGIALGMSGTALQGMMRNPLVGPDLVGVTSGAAFGAFMAMYLSWPPVGIIALAVSGGIGAMACTFGLAKLGHAGTDGVVLILAGIFVGAFFIACIGVIEFVAPDWKLPTMIFWMLGSFVGADPQKVFMVTIPTLLGGSILMLLRWRLNLLSLGDLDAASLGVNVHRLRWIIIAIVSLIIAAQVSVSGIVGWIGLVIPHCARMLVGPDHRRLLPASALLGALFVLGLDDFTRAVVQAEIPIGVITAIMGTPVICFLFWRTQSKGWIND